MSDSNIELRDVIESDLEVFYENESDPEAIYMAAFTREDPTDRAAFDAYWAKVLSKEDVLIQTILCDSVAIGSVLKFEMFGDTDLSYWINKAYWGRGIATQAVKLFLELLKERPLHARAASDNHASIRVLEKCGFKQIGTEKGFANARGKEIEETVLILEK